MTTMTITHILTPLKPTYLYRFNSIIEQSVLETFISMIADEPYSQVENDMDLYEEIFITYMIDKGWKELADEEQSPTPEFYQTLLHLNKRYIEQEVSTLF